MSEKIELQRTHEYSDSSTIIKKLETDLARITSQYGMEIEDFRALVLKLEGQLDALAEEVREANEKI